MDLAHQVIVLYAVTKGMIDSVQVDRITDWERGLHEYLDTNAEDLLGDIREQRALNDKIIAKIEKAITDWNGAFEASEGSE